MARLIILLAFAALGFFYPGTAQAQAQAGESFLPIPPGSGQGLHNAISPEVVFYDLPDFVRESPLRNAFMVVALGVILIAIGVKVMNAARQNNASEVITSIAFGLVFFVFALFSHNLVKQVYMLGNELALTIPSNTSNINRGLGNVYLTSMASAAIDLTEGSLVTTDGSALDEAESRGWLQRAGSFVARPITGTMTKIQQVSGMVMDAGGTFMNLASWVFRIAITIFTTLLTAMISYMLAFFISLFDLARFFLLHLAVILIPFFIAALFTQTLRSQGLSTVLMVVAIALWPIGWAIGHIGTMAMLRAMATLTVVNQDQADMSRMLYIQTVEREEGVTVMRQPDSEAPSGQTEVREADRIVTPEESASLIRAMDDGVAWIFHTLAMFLLALGVVAWGTIVTFGTPIVINKMFTAGGEVGMQMVMQTGMAAAGGLKTAGVGLAAATAGLATGGMAAIAAMKTGGFMAGAKALGGVFGKALGQGARAVGQGVNSALSSSSNAAGSQIGRGFTPRSPNKLPAAPGTGGSAVPPQGGQRPPAGGSTGPTPQGGGSTQPPRSDGFERGRDLPRNPPKP